MAVFSLMKYILLILLVTMGLLAGPAPLHAQLRFSADFDNGRLDSVTTLGDTLVLWPDVPLHVRVTGVLNAQPQFAVFSGSDYRMRRGHRMVYRYEGERVWQHCDTGSLRGEWYYFSNHTPFRADTVYLAYWTPFTYGDMVRWMDQIAGHPYVRHPGPRGVTLQGRAIYGFAVTDTAVPDADKAHVVVISRQHCVEAPGSYVAKGMADFLLHDEGNIAEELRQRCVFHFYPMASPDPVFHGCDQSLGGFGATNRQWAPGAPDSVLATDPAFETNVLRRAIVEETGGTAWIGFDIHSHPGHIGQWYYWGAKSGADSADASALVRAISLRDGSLHADGARLSPIIAQDLHSVSCDCADHWLYGTLGALAFTLEAGSVPPAAAERIEGAGRAICEGIHARLEEVTSIETAPSVLPAGITLSNFPNPFRAETTIRFTLPTRSSAQLLLVDMLGRSRSLLTGETWYAPGSHVIEFDAGTLPPGMYRLVLIAGSDRRSRLVQIVR